MIDVRLQKKRIGLKIPKSIEDLNGDLNADYGEAKSGSTRKAIDALEQAYSYSYKKEPSLADINDKLDTILEHFRIQYPRPETEG